METVVLLSVLLLMSVGGLLAYVICSPTQIGQPASLVPFTVLPVTDAAPSTKAFLELFAGQVSWMDSSVLQCVVLVHPDGDENTAELCRELARQYDFFTCMSLTQAQGLLAQRLMFTEITEKNLESGCNSSRNIV